MKEALNLFWQNRAPRERTIIAFAGALLLASLLVSIWYSANRARDRLRASVLTLQTDAMQVNRDALEIERLRALGAPAASRSDVRALVESQSNAAGLSRAVTRIDAAGPDRVSVVFGAVAFADWLSFLQTLQVHHVRLESARVVAMTTPGTVSVNANFVREPVQ